MIPAETTVLTMKQRRTFVCRRRTLSVFFSSRYGRRMPWVRESCKNLKEVMSQISAFGVVRPGAGQSTPAQP